MVTTELDHIIVARLGDSMFLELLAIDPAAPPPLRPRWFQLDDPALQAELAAQPRLLTWVVRTPQITDTVAASAQPLGAIEPMQRGDLRWQITIPGGGSLVQGGLIPTVIQWSDGPLPVTRMPDLGFALDRLEVVHSDPAAYRRDLASIGADRHVEITAGTPPHLIAHIRTPHGPRVLR
jgi:hypothetical protein